MEIYTGKFIVIEGGDGCGKSTQVDMLEKYLKEKNFDIVRTHEPGGTKVGEGIRNLVLSPDIPKNVRTQLFLFEAARSQLVADVIKPALKKGKIVLTDRWYYATEAYQGYGGGLDLELIKIFNYTATQGVNADLSVIIDIPPKKGLKKIETTEFGKKDFFESKKLEFHKKVNDGYRAIAAKYSNINLINYIDGNPRLMHKEIIGYVNELLKIK
jgi:dTMP kinase